MPEWWSYSLSDFLLFSPRTYYRLIERHNLAVWPGQIVTLGLGIWLLALVQRRTAGHGRVICGTLAALWAWTTGAFIWMRYATINWAVMYLVPLLVLQILLLLWIGVLQDRVRFHLGRGFADIAGATLLTTSLFAYPALAPLLGRSWRQAEVFGIAPDPTVIGTAGLLLLIDPPQWKLGAVPLVWCFFSGLTLWAMKSPEAIVLALATITFIAAGFRQRHPGSTAAVQRRLQS